MSTPKEKARELYEKYISSENSLQIQLKLTGFTEIKRKGKKHSLIAVNEIETVLLQERVFESLDYWQEVKQEINKI